MTAAVNNSQATDRQIIRVDGIPIDVLTEDHAIAFILDRLDKGKGGVVATPNLDHLRLFERSEEVRDGYERADLSLADGMPLIWASRLSGTPLPERVAGSDLTVSLARAAASANRSLFLLGGNPGVAATAGEKLEKENPGLKVSGVYCPPFEFEKNTEEMNRVKQMLTEAGCPDIVYVGVSFPRSLHICHELHAEFPQSWFLGIGISLSFISGEVSRAPVWMSEHGLEWLHRFGQEPRRLGRRYLVHGVPYCLRLLQRSLRARFSRSG